jgi:hypothetical protein
MENPIFTFATPTIISGVSLSGALLGDLKALITCFLQTPLYLNPIVIYCFSVIFAVNVSLGEQGETRLPHCKENRRWNLEL